MSSENSSKSEKTGKFTGLVERYPILKKPVAIGSVAVLTVTTIGGLLDGGRSIKEAALGIRNSFVKNDDPEKDMSQLLAEPSSSVQPKNQLAIHYGDASEELHPVTPGYSANGSPLLGANLGPDASFDPLHPEANLPEADPSVTLIKAKARTIEVPEKTDKADGEKPPLEDLRLPEVDEM